MTKDKVKLLSEEDMKGIFDALNAGVKEGVILPEQKEQHLAALLAVAVRSISGSRPIVAVETLCNFSAFLMLNYAEPTINPPIKGDSHAE